ncbi:MAG: class I SAM-dependent methyltransferase [Xanthobacteraceae bacterium]
MEDTAYIAGHLAFSERRTNIVPNWFSLLEFAGVRFSVRRDVCSHGRLQQEILEIGWDRNSMGNQSSPEWQSLSERLEFEERPCPICKQHSGRPLHQRKIASYDMSFWLCTNCDTIYAKKALTAGSLHKVFNSKDFFSAGNPGGDNIDYYDFIGGERYLRKTARGRINRIKKFKPQGKLLEVASAAGFFLIESKEAGFDTQGVEISAPMAEYASQRWQVPVAGESIDTYELSPGEYDVIASWGVMTIVQDPLSVIRKFHQALKPGGIWAFNTYYHDGLWHHMFGGRWIALAVQARQVFSSRGLIQIISREGFRLRSHRRDCPHTDFLKIADQLAWNTGWRWLVPSLRATGLQDLVIRVPLPDVYEYIWEKE